MELEKKFQHAQYIIGFMNNYSQTNPSSQEVTIACGDLKVKTYLIVIASISTFFRKLLSELSFTSDEDITIILPEQDTMHIETFFRYLYSREVTTIFSPEDLPALKEVFKVFSIDFFDKILDDYEMEDNSDQIETSDEDHLNDEEDRAEADSVSRTNENMPFQDRMKKKLSFQSKSASKILCQFCRKEYQHIKARNKHLISDHLEQCKQKGLVYQCKICNVCFVTPRGLDKHSIRIHGVEHQVIQRKSDFHSNESRTIEQLRCPFGHNGEATFSSVKDLKIHIKNSHPDKDKSCWACGADCGSRQSLEQHIQSHETSSYEGRYFFNCEICNMKFLSEYNLVTHKRDMHSEANTLQCRICGKEFRNKKFLRSHEAKHLTGEVLMPGEVVLYKCPVEVSESGMTCDKVFKLKCNLDRHIRSHQRIKTHTCEDCGKSFVDSTRLKEHRWIHTDHRPFQCRFCDKSFRHQNNLKNHEANIHGESKKFSCEVCGKKFVYAYQLRTHISTHQSSRSHLEERPSATTKNSRIELDQQIVQTIYQCSLCHKVFGNMQLLQDHCLEHSDVQTATDQAENQLPLEHVGDEAGGSQYVVVYDVPTDG